MYINQSDPHFRDTLEKIFKQKVYLDDNMIFPAAGGEDEGELGEVYITAPDTALIVFYEEYLAQSYGPCMEIQSLGSTPSKERHNSWDQLP